MIRRDALALALALAVAAFPGDRVAWAEPPQEVNDPGASDKVGAGVRLEMAPVEPAIAGRRLAVRLAIVNAGDRDVRLTYDRVRWIRWHGYSAVWAHESCCEIDLGSYTTRGFSHPLVPGREICPDPAQVFGLKPGERLLRDAQISLEGASAGTVELIVNVQLIEVTSGARCEKARLFEREARTTVSVQPPKARKARQRL